MKTEEKKQVFLFPILFGLLNFPNNDIQAWFTASFFSYIYMLPCLDGGYCAQWCWGVKDLKEEMNKGPCLDLSSQKHPDFIRKSPALSSHVELPYQEKGNKELFKGFARCMGADGQSSVVLTYLPHPPTFLLLLLDSICQDRTWKAADISWAFLVTTSCKVTLGS